MNAILKEDPPEISPSGRQIPPGLERIVAHCLEKKPDERFQSARDLAFDLGSLSTATSIGGVGRAAPAASRWTRRAVFSAVGPDRPRSRVLGGNAPAARRAERQTVRLQRLTFRRGNILSRPLRARRPDRRLRRRLGGQALELFSVRTDSVESRPLGLDHANVLSVSATGELAVQLRKGSFQTRGPGTLARVPLGGGAARELQDKVYLGGVGARRREPGRHVPRAYGQGTARVPRRPTRRRIVLPAEQCRQGLSRRRARLRRGRLQRHVHHLGLRPAGPEAGARPGPEGLPGLCLVAAYGRALLHRRKANRRDRRTGRLACGERASGLAGSERASIFTTSLPTAGCSSNGSSRGRESSGGPQTKRRNGISAGSTARICVPSHATAPGSSSPRRAKVPARPAASTSAEPTDRPPYASATGSRGASRRTASGPWRSR